MVRSIFALSTFTFVSALPSVDKRLSGPSVRLNYGNVIGSSAHGIDTYKGIPYARPPVGDLQLRPPQDITQNLGTVMAVGIPKGCIQQRSSLNAAGLPGIVNNVLGTASTVTGTSEDCLTINVQVPSGTKAGAKLPVLFWIYVSTIINMYLASPHSVGWRFRVRSHTVVRWITDHSQFCWTENSDHIRSH